MRAILIDPFTRTIEFVDLPIASDEGALKALYQAIFHADHGMVQALDLGADHDLWVDEEGLLTDWADQAFFRINDNAPIAGRGVILAHNDEGSCTSCFAPIEPVRRAVSWVYPEGVDVPVPTITPMDENWEPAGPSETIGADDGTGRWTYFNHGGKQ